MSLQVRLREEGKGQLLGKMRGESARPGKRPLRALSASEKMEAIQRVHEGESKASVARDIGVPESTLRGWCKSEHKIRNMARGSSTPDSEAHSPASSSGANPLLASSNFSSEDEAMGPSAKKFKIDGDNGEIGDSKFLDAKQATQKQIEYLSLMSQLITGGVRPDNNSILYQQLRLFSNAQNTASSLLGLSPTNNLNASALAASTAQAVGLVENGLQYSKSSVGQNASKRSSSASSSSPSHMSAIVPSKSDLRKSTSPEVESSSTPLTASSPKKITTTTTTTTEQSNGQQQQQTTRNSTGTSSNGVRGSNRKIDESLWKWLSQQQQLAGQQHAPVSPGGDGSWFWQWYKQCGYPIIPVSTPPPSPSVKKSPSKTKAVLDNLLCNNQDNARKNLNSAINAEGEENNAEAAAQLEEAQTTTAEEAFNHVDKFFSWLDTCSDPSVCMSKVTEFKYMVYNIRKNRLQNKK